jgi:alkanesulfonate monooxygenase SsuD/methylene tetrahydromethanopterin reductase-like flavin-dependent oxidoreductase (luciferase family)
MDFGVGFLSYDGCWQDAAKAEAAGFSHAWFVDGPATYNDVFVCMALAAQATERIKIGSLVAIPRHRIAPVTARAAASVDRLAPGRTILGLGTGFTSRAALGLKPIKVEELREGAYHCKALLEGKRIEYHEGTREGYASFWDYARFPSKDVPVPVFIAADGPGALDVTGQLADGWISALQWPDRANHQTSDGDPEPPTSLRRRQALVADAAAKAGRSLSDIYTMVSTSWCVLNDGESARSPRALERVGPYAVLAHFHKYVESPRLLEAAPDKVKREVQVYIDHVLKDAPRSAEELHQHLHAGHLNYLIDGEADHLTSEHVCSATITGTADEVVAAMRALERAGVNQVTLWPPIALIDDIFKEFQEEIIPRLAPSRT